MTSYAHYTIVRICCDTVLIKCVFVCVRHSFSLGSFKRSLAKHESVEQIMLDFGELLDATTVTKKRNRTESKYIMRGSPMAKS